MSFISPSSSLQSTLARLASPARVDAATTVRQGLQQAAALDNASSTSVALGQAGNKLAGLTYTAQGVVPVQDAAASAATQDADDPVTALLQRNVAAGFSGSRLQGVGAALLGRFDPSLEGMAGPLELNVDAERPGVKQAVSAGLKITTASGTEVALNLRSTAQGLSVQVEYEGDLTDAERAALADLAQGFQDALDGLDGTSPRMNLAGLLRYDATALSSVALSAEIQAGDRTTLSIEFKADAAARSLRVEGADGKIDVSVDTKDASILGTKAQREAAIDGYMRQADQASLRGKADADLVAMFKDAFVQMHSHYGQQEAAAPASLSRSGKTLAQASAAVLSGMADFKASVTATSEQTNPMRPDESTSFAFRTSQSTTVGVDRSRDREVSQTSETRLKASYHVALTPDIPLSLGTARSSQNYYYRIIEDVSERQTDVVYRQGKLLEAAQRQSESQSMQQLKYLRGEVVEDITTPTTKSDVVSLLVAADAAQQRDGDDPSRRETAALGAANQEARTTSFKARLIALLDRVLGK